MYKTKEAKSRKRLLTGVNLKDSKVTEFLIRPEFYVTFA